MYQQIPLSIITKNNTAGVGTNKFNVWFITNLNEVRDESAQ
jgi:hypothetical protein